MLFSGPEESWELETGAPGRQGSRICGQTDCEGSQGQGALEMLQVVWDVGNVDFLG